MSKKIYLNNEGRQGLFEGIEEMYKAVSSTLGPMGKLVIIKSGIEDPMITKDGVTVANSMDSDDALKNTAMQMFKKACSKMDTDSGDGTTTTSILCYFMIKKGFEDLEKSIDPINYRRDMERAVDDFKNYISSKAIAIPEDGIDMLTKVAVISANNDAVLGRNIAEAVIAAGRYGKVNVLNSLRSVSGYEKIEGFVVDLGLANQTFGLDIKTGHFIAEDAFVLLHKGHLTSKQEWLAIMKEFDRKAHSLVIIAQDYSTEIIEQAHYINNMYKDKKVCLVRNNLRENEFLSIYEDLAAYTGAEIVDEFSYSGEFGSIEHITVKTGHMILSKTSHDISAHIELLEEKLSEEKLPAMQDIYKKRISRLESGIVNFFVGGNSDIETKEKFDRVQDAVNACQAAMEKGIVDGGGQSFMAFSISKAFSTTGKENAPGYENVRLALMQVLTQLYLSSLKTTPWDELVKKCYDGVGYDFKDNLYCDMVDKGIIDPAKIVVNAVVNAASVASTILLTECVIID